jgi:hypothetical protein
MPSPTQRSLAHLLNLGYRVAVVERWNPHARIRQDLFGVLDLLAVKDGEILGVQTTSGSNVAARLAKIADSEAVPDLRRAGMRLEVHGWRKLKAGWCVRVEDVS